MKFIAPKNKLLLIFLFCFSVHFFGQNNINFKHIAPQINNNTIFVNQTAQDSLGNIWMVCANGILKYNGYGYHLIPKKEIFPEINDNDYINHIERDSNKSLWIKSYNGLLTKYNSYKGEFENNFNSFKASIQALKSKEDDVWFITKTGQLYSHINNKTEMIVTIPNINGIDNEARNIEIGNNQEVYISTSKGKIYVYYKDTKMLSELIGPYTDYPGPIVLQVDNDNKLWIGTEAFGLLLYDIDKETFIQEDFFKENITAVNKELFINLFLDSNNNIWGGTDGDGLYKINNKTGKINIYKKDNANKFSLNSNTVLHINEDNHQNIWAVTNYGTINVVPKSNKNIKYHSGADNNTPLRILSVYKSKKGTLWMGTDGTGLSKVEEGNKKAQSFFNDRDKDFYVQSITEDDKNNIWFGTYKNGLWFYNHKLNTFKNIPVINNKNQKATDIRSVFKDSKGRIWAGSNVAINVYSANQNLLASFNTENKSGLDGIILESIIEDGNQNIWLGILGGGLFKFNEDTKAINNSTFTNYKSDFNDIVLGIKSMCIGKDNNIWLISDTSKLFLFDTTSKTFKDFNYIKTLNTSFLNSIVSEDPYNLWISSSNGIYHFNTKTNSVTTFYTTDGFQNNYYIPRSAFKDKNGLLYFGTQEGLNFFDPKKLIKEKLNAKLFINDIQVLNKSAKTLLENQITSDVFNLDHLYLDNNQSSFSLKFAAIDNILKPSFSYSYKLDGFDKEWKTVYTEGLATYTNIPSGKYTLDIKAHEMNETAVISRKKIGITIKNPFWNTPIAYLLYLILLSLLIYGIIKWYNLRKKLLISKISRRKENELHNAKINFFTKMSHEIQTPITLILGPIDDMLKRAETDGNRLLKERLNIISNNASRLSRIARELTLVKNKELNRLKLSVTKNNLHNDITNICSSFKELARIKNIDFSINCQKNLDDTWYDKDKLEHILYNLLSNAFKFTPKQGNIQVSVTPLNEKGFIKILVSDSGHGIKEDELNKVFKIFYRSENNKNANGSGIGLALTKELVNLHKGTIKVESTIGESTVFTVKLPVFERDYTNSERITYSSNKSQLKDVENINLESYENFDQSEKTILIVEDNFELQSFLKDLFMKQFNILLAENGQEGFYYAKNNIPDLILSDIMMPIMGGIEMCEKLKKNNQTKHIPIILLTAKNSTKAKIEGLKTGAIEYINKPFNTNELLLKVNNIFASKENIISKYRKELINKPEIIINKSQDEVFLENLVSVANERLKDSNFKVEELTETLNMSYSSLYRKCLTLTGLNLIDFIKILRLKKAAILLVKYGYTISEVAYMVGYNDPKYFSKNFKRQFNVTPKEFKNKAPSKENITDYLKKYNVDMVDFKNDEGSK